MLDISGLLMRLGQSYVMSPFFSSPWVALPRDGMRGAFSRRPTSVRVGWCLPTLSGFEGGLECPRSGGSKQVRAW